jgi:hypothetical protein
VTEPAGVQKPANRDVASGGWRLLHRPRPQNGQAP